MEVGRGIGVRSWDFPQFLLRFLGPAAAHNKEKTEAHQARSGRRGGSASRPPSHARLLTPPCRPIVEQVVLIPMNFGNITQTGPLLQDLSIESIAKRVALRLDGRYRHFGGSEY